MSIARASTSVGGLFRNVTLYHELFEPLRNAITRASAARLGSRARVQNCVCVCEARERQSEPYYSCAGIAHGAHIRADAAVLNREDGVFGRRARAVATACRDR